MHRTTCVLMSVLLIIAEGLIVKGPSGPLVAPLGSSVVLPCSVDQLLSVKGLEVEWRRTDSDTLIHLFQDGESQTGAQQEDYQDRAHFFTEEIQRGNFSLRLDNVRAEDEGQYTCTVHSQEETGETVIEIKVNDVERLRVSGSSRSTSVSVGEDVTLSCSVDSHIPSKDLEISWMKTDEDEDIVVLLYQNNKALPEASVERYRDRVEFFTDEIPKGNFSLRLKSVRTEDKGVYMCQVFAGRLSANTTAVLEQLGFSVLHIMVLILCIFASGSALLLFCLIYCRSSTNDTVFRLQMFLIFCPNLIMFLTFVLWGVSEGSLSESVSCCALYFLRPLMLLWAAPCVNDFTGMGKDQTDCASDKSIRICGDYKVTINQNLEEKTYPLPNTEDLFAKLAGGTLFSNLDLAHDYQQLKLDQNSVKYLTNDIHHGLYKYYYLRYGVASATFIFQAVMDQILQGLDHVTSFLNDILVIITLSIGNQLST
ncbi:butyrophilin 2 isoform X2 [Labeo rohita]|uniref:Butyrophilin 2 isoform X2 n=1 Tax=Labeo rohita TaxID=84645 RepID=A0A498LZ83_LABRO|nr:butyrophilin 2 isoform X2 [Labeo rohita]